MKNRWLSFTFLAVVLTVTQGYKFRCWAFCTDQTGVQNDYVDERDHCREYAQLKAMEMRRAGTPEDGSRRSELVALFSECMSRNGWTVPDGKEDRKGGAAPKAITAAPAAIASPIAAAAAAPAPRPAGENKAYLSRAADCAFARQAASASRHSALRAKACDLECADRLKATGPEAPRPAACPPESSANLSRGSERD